MHTCIWNHHDIVNWLYPSTKAKVKKKPARHPHLLVTRVQRARCSELRLWSLTAGFWVPAPPPRSLEELTASSLEGCCEGRSTSLMQRAWNSASPSEHSLRASFSRLPPERPPRTRPSPPVSPLPSLGLWWMGEPFSSVAVGYKFYPRLRLRADSHPASGSSSTAPAALVALDAELPEYFLGVPKSRYPLNDHVWEAARTAQSAAPGAGGVSYGLCCVGPAPCISASFPETLFSDLIEKLFSKDE